MNNSLTIKLNIVRYMARIAWIKLLLFFLKKERKKAQSKLKNLPTKPGNKLKLLRDGTEACKRSLQDR